MRVSLIVKHDVPCLMWLFHIQREKYLLFSTKILEIQLSIKSFEKLQMQRSCH